MSVWSWCLFPYLTPLVNHCRKWGWFAEFMKLFPERSVAQQEKDPRKTSDLAERVAKGRKMQAARVAASGKLTEGQLRKIQRDIELTQRNMEVFGELLSELQTGEEHPDDKALIYQVSETCKEMQARVLELVGIVQHRPLTALLLEVNDNMNNLFLRYERHQNNVDTSKTGPEAAGVVSPGAVHLDIMPGDVTDGPQLAAVANAKETDFEEMEAWMKEADAGKDATGEGMTSSEFDRFLAERAKAVEAGEKS